MSIDEVLNALNRLRHSGQDETSPVPAPPATKTTREPATSHAVPEAPAPEVPHESHANATNDLDTLWTRLLEALERASRFTHTYLVQAHPVSLAKNTLTIVFDPEFEDQMGLADNARTHEVLRTKLAELGHPGTAVRFLIAEMPAARRQAAPSPAEIEDVSPVEPSPAPAPRPRASPRTKEAPKPPPPTFDKNEFKKDPLIQKALEVFKGKIVDVRG